MEEDALSADKLSHKAHSVLVEMWQEACDRGSRLGFRVVSGSMEPLIQVGDVVKITRVEPSSVHIGDIVAFQQGQSVVVHRVIGKSPSNQQLIFRHRGDAGASSGEIPAENLIGKVSAIEKEGREIFLDTTRHAMSNRVLGWRLRFVDGLGRGQHKHIGIGVRLALRPMWRLCRSLLYWRL